MILTANGKYVLFLCVTMAAGLGSSFSPQLSQNKKSATKLPAAIEESASLIVAAESWRQYVFPIVTAGVLIDIVLGSPIANSVLKPLRGGDAEAPAGEEGQNQPRQGPFGGFLAASPPSFDETRTKERVDSQKVADDAITRAQNALELRKYLDDRKTDFDRMDEMKRELDAGMQDFDSDYQNRAKDISKELEKRKMSD